MTSSTTEQQAPGRRVVVASRVEPEDMERLKEEAARTRRTISALVADAIHYGLPIVQDQPW